MQMQPVASSLCYVLASLVLLAPSSSVLADQSDVCTELPEETVRACALCAATMRVDMDTCCTEGDVLKFCTYLMTEVQAGELGGNDVTAEQDVMSKRGWLSNPGRYGEAKRDRAGFLLKRPRNNFLGKRSGMDQDLEFGDDKRIRPFLGKRIRPFLGKRPDSPLYAIDDAEEDADKRIRPFLGKRLQDGFPYGDNKRIRPFLGKKARPFLGKRMSEDNLLEQQALEEFLHAAEPYTEDELDKRAGKSYYGKKARPFLGKRDDDSFDLAEDMDKRARPFLGKKARPFLGKRSIAENTEQVDSLSDNTQQQQ